MYLGRNKFSIKKNMIGNNLRKIIEQLLLMFCMLKRKYIYIYCAYVFPF